MPTHALNCPNCGAPLPDPEGRSVVICEHCHTAVQIQLPAPPRDTEPAIESAAPMEVSEHASLTRVPADDLARIKQLLTERRKVEAVKVYYESMGGSLAEAKEAVDAIEAGLGYAPAPMAATVRQSPDDLAVIRQLVAAGRKIDAIKLYREQTGTSLQEAKQSVEMIAAQMPRGRPATGTHTTPLFDRGCLNVISGIMIFTLLVCGGCGVYVQNTGVYRCAMRELKADANLAEVLGDEINGGYLVLSPGFSQEVAFDGTSNTEMAFFTPMWGTDGVGVAYIEAVSRGGSDSAGMRATLFKNFKRYVISTWHSIECP